MSNLQHQDISKPRPQRFEVYTLLPDGKGFTIKDCKFVFKIDRHGGWRDQHGHYYNANGEPDFQPQDAQLTPSEGSFNSDEAANDYDEFEPNYDEDEGQDDNYSSWEIRNAQKISKNRQLLSQYPADKNLRVYFENMSARTSPKIVYEAYSKKVDGILNIIFDQEEEDHRRNGKGHFIMKNIEKAKDLIMLEGQKIIQRQVHFKVEKLNELIMFPISQKELLPFQNNQSKNTKKIYTNKQEVGKTEVPKFKAVPYQQIVKQQKNNQKKKEQTKPSNQQNKSIVKQVKQIKTEEVSPFQIYGLNFDIFESKTRFYNWFNENGGDKDKDIKSINKQEKDGKIKITIEINEKIVQKLNNKLYNNKAVKFSKV